jgi:hypothetical protein
MDGRIKAIQASLDAKRKELKRLTQEQQELESSAPTADLQGAITRLNAEVSSSEGCWQQLSSEPSSKSLTRTAERVKRCPGVTRGGRPNRQELGQVAEGVDCEAQNIYSVSHTTQELADRPGSLARSKTVVRTVRNWRKRRELSTMTMTRKRWRKASCASLP